MKKLRLALAVAVVAFFTVIAPSPAQAYPGVTVTVSDHELVGGNDVTITATVDPAIDCDEWELTYQGDTRTGSGTSITATFSTPEVDERTETNSFATCFFDNDIFDGPNAAPSVSGGGGAGTLGTLVMDPDSASGVGDVILLPLGDDNDDDDDDGNGGGDNGDGGGILPNTGGERLAWLVIGAMLVLVGAGVVVASRRRDA